VEEPLRSYITHRFSEASGGWISKEKEYVIDEVTIRVTLDGEQSVAIYDNPSALLLAVAPTMKQALEKLPRALDYHFIPVVPKRKAFADGKPCCDQMKQKPGTPLKIRIVPSMLQARIDSDDAVIGDETRRLFVDNRMDWEVIVHCWRPLITAPPGYVEQDMREMIAGDPGGFVPWEKMPPGAWPTLRKKFTEGNGGR